MFGCIGNAKDEKSKNDNQIQLKCHFDLSVRPFECVHIDTAKNKCTERNRIVVERLLD